MESKSTSCVLHRKAPSFRYYPYASGSGGSGKDDIKNEVVRLGVEFSVCVAESMFLLCDDIRTLLFFCVKLWKRQFHPVIKRLILVIHYVYTKDIKRVYQKSGDGKSAQWNLIKTTWNDFVCGIIVLNRLVLLVRRRKHCSFDDRLLSSAIAKYKQDVKNLENKLRSAKDVSEANGFAKERIEFNIFQFWKSLFDKEADEEIPREIFSELFGPIVGETWDKEIKALPLYSPPYILGRDFVKHELKHEVVRLGVKLSLHVAQVMFLLCDDIRSMLWFCYKLQRDAKRYFYPNSPVLERVIRVIHFVYFRYIEPKKNGLYRNDGLSVQLRLARPTWKNFDDAILSMDILVRILIRGGICACAREHTSSIEQELNKVGDKLSYGKVVSEANGFTREAMEPNFFGLWKSLFDKEAKETTRTLKLITNGILRDLFLPLHNEVAP